MAAAPADVGDAWLQLPSGVCLRVLPTDAGVSPSLCCAMTWWLVWCGSYDMVAKDIHQGAWQGSGILFVLLLLLLLVVLSCVTRRSISRLPTSSQACIHATVRQKTFIHAGSTLAVSVRIRAQAPA